MSILCSAATLLLIMPTDITGFQAVQHSFLRAPPASPIIETLSAINHQSLQSHLMHFQRGFSSRSSVSWNYSISLTSVVISTREIRVIEREMVSAIYFALVLLTSLFWSPVMSWGPSTHYYFTCSALSNLANCEGSSSHLLAGTEMPDAFFFGSFVDPSICLGFGELHDIHFATYMLLAARNMSTNSSSDLVRFAEGYGAHIVADFAGFWPGGYLGNGHMQTPSIVNWVSLWPFMTAVDSYVAHSLARPAAAGVPTVSSAVAGFVSSSAHAYQMLDPSIGPVPNSNQVQQCAAQWQQVVSTETKVAIATPSQVYEYQMVSNDVFNATSFSQAASHFSMASSCAISGIKTWLAAVAAPNATVAGVADLMFSYFASQFSSGKCAPKMSTLEESGRHVWNGKRRVAV